jgi:hypothetical protein
MQTCIALFIHIDPKLQLESRKKDRDGYMRSLVKYIKKEEEISFVSFY